MCPNLTGLSTRFFVHFFKSVRLINFLVCLFPSLNQFGFVHFKVTKRKLGVKEKFAQKWFYRNAEFYDDFQTVEKMARTDKKYDQ